MDYEKQFGSQNSHSSGSQKLPCPGKSFKDNNRLKIHVDIDNNLSTSSTFSSTSHLLLFVICFSS
jgi:hypothetical protein